MLGHQYTHLVIIEQTIYDRAKLRFTVYIKNIQFNQQQRNLQKRKRFDFNYYNPAMRIEGVH